MSGNITWRDFSKGFPLSFTNIIVTRCHMSRGKAVSDPVVDVGFMMVEAGRHKFYSCLNGRSFDIDDILFWAGLPVPATGSLEKEGV